MVSQAASSYRVEILENERQWRSQSAQWDQLAGEIPFLRMQWLYRWWEHYGRDRGELTVLHVSDVHGATRGFAPWWRTSSYAAGRVLQFLGSGDVCSDYLGLLARSEDAVPVADSVAQWLSTNRSWDVLELDGAVESDVTVQRLVQECRKRGMPVGEKPAMNCWRLALPSSWDEYLAMLSKCHRKQLRRIDRRMLQTGELTFREAKSERDRERALGNLVRLHQRRWERAGEPGVFACKRFLGFLRQVSVDWFEQGRVKLYELTHGERPVASEIHFAAGGVSFAYQSGVDPDSLELEPGRALNCAVIQHLIREGYTAVDYLRGDEPYKQHLRARPNRLTHYRIGAPKPSGRLRHQAWVAGGLVKSWIKGTGSVGGVEAP